MRLLGLRRAPPPRRPAAGGSDPRSGTSRRRRDPGPSSSSCSGAMLPTDLAIFSPVAWIMPLCIHSRASSAPRAAARLGGLVLVVGEDQVRAPAVDIEADAERGLGHRRALDVPARPSRPPGRRPAGVLAGLVALPQREVQRVVLALGALDALALVHVLEPAVREARRRRGRSARGRRRLRRRRRRARASISVCDVGDDRPDRLGGQGLVVGTAQARGGRCRRCRRRSSAPASSTLGTPCTRAAS